MKWSFKMLLILSSTFLSNSICFSQKDKDNNRLKLIREIPADTIDVFIRNYGKDSLIKKIDKTLKQSVLWMNTHVQNMNNATEINKLFAISKKFKLGFDTIFIPEYRLNESIYQLYEFKEGAVLQNSITLDSLKKTNANIQKLMFDNINYEISRNSCVTLLDTNTKINVAYFDSIYTKYFDVNDKDFIQPYWIFTQFAKNIPNQSKVPIIYKNKIFSKIYKTYNLSKSVNGYNMQINKISSQNVINMQQPIIVLAYGLYGGNLTLKNSAANLFYLLQTINKNGENGWQENQGSYLNNDIKTTMHAIWSLCEYKNLLQNYIVHKNEDIKK